MALEEVKARISLLMEELSERPEDAHALQERIREQLEGLKAMGMPLPQDLVDLEHYLDEDLDARNEPEDAPGANDVRAPDEPPARA